MAQQVMTLWTGNTAENHGGDFSGYNEIRHSRPLLRDLSLARLWVRSCIVDSQMIIIQFPPDAHGCLHLKVIDCQRKWFANGQQNVLSQRKKRKNETDR